MKPPPRMLDDATLSPALRDMLERAATAPDPYDPLQGEARLSAALAAGAGASAESAPPPPAPVAGAPAGASGLLGSGVAKLGAVAATVAVVGATVLGLRERPAPQPPARAPNAVVSAPVAAPPALAPAPPPRIEQPLERPVDVPAALLAEQARRPSSAPDADEALRREIAQVGRIKRVLDQNPALAYSLAQAGHREFPRGMLHEEREALAVLSLWNLGRGAEARRRAEAFLARYPNSSVRGQLERRLAAERGDDAAR
jgi:hypothetical protein